MLKFFTANRCSLCTMVSAQAAPKVYKIQDQGMNFEEIKASITYKHTPKCTKNKQILVRATKDHIKTVTSLLEKYQVDIKYLKADRRIFHETQWNIEKKILLLQEMGVERITTSHIVNFVLNMYLTVPLYKANLDLPAERKISEKLLSTVESSKINPKTLDNLDESLLMKLYYSEVINYYLKEELELTVNEAKRISYKKYSPVLYNSFRLLQRLIKLIKEDWKFSNSLIVKNYYWLLGHHPEHGVMAIEMVKSHYEDLNINKLILRCPKLLHYDLKELKILLAHMKSYNVTAQMIQSAPEIFHLTPFEFKSRVISLLQNPLTLVYEKHPRFLVLVRDYHITLPRIKYLEEKNLKHATIYTLTTFHNYIRHLTAVRKLNKPNLVSFLKLQFTEDVEELFLQLKKHPYYPCVPLVDMNATLAYLLDTYYKTTVSKHIYAVLYSVDDLKAAREEILKDANKKMTQEVLLAMCVYKIETLFNFSGCGALQHNKYSESLQANIEQENKDTSKEELFL